MRIARKLLLLATMAAAVLALSATTASAGPVVITDEEGPGNNHACPALNENVHTVTGGCHGWFESEEIGIPLFAHTGTAEVPVSNCTVELEARLRSDGTGHVTRALFGVADGTVACTRAPCDEANGTFIPWPVSVIEVAPSDERVEATFCLRTLPAGPGGVGTLCDIHLPIRTLTGSHMYEVGTNGTQAACENLPGVEIENHFVQHEAAEAGEAMELSH